MNYKFNVDKWVEAILPSVLMLNNRLKILQAHLKPLQTLTNEFNLLRDGINFKTKYNCQQKVLAALLNRLFDPVHKRIRIITSSDVKGLYYQFYASEINPDIKYSYFASEANPGTQLYSYYYSEFTGGYRFIVRIPNALNTPETITAIKGWVNYYRFESLNFTIEII